MRENLSTGKRVSLIAALAAMWQLGTGVATAQQAPPPSPPPAAAAPPPPGAAAAPAPAAPASNAMSNPSMSGPLVANPNPVSIDTPPIGTVYITGAVSGLGLFQGTPVVAAGDRSTQFDLDNAQVSIQNTSGRFQFFLEPGVYSFPTVGVPYTKMATTVANAFGGLPVAWGKVVFNDNFNIQGGRLPTLIGAEYGFTFQNMNIERGLLWNQEPIVSQGVQANLTTGPVAWALSWNDGFFSRDYNWLSGSATWTINPANSLVLAGGGPVSRNTTIGFATPPAQNNSTIIEAAYTYNAAPWTVTPYIQYTHVDSDPGLGIPASAETLGGAVLASYAITDKISLAGRWEYIGSSGGTNLLGYGPGSSAMSFTLTPTFQSGIFFARAEGSITTLSSITPGFGFGTGGGKTQGRFLVETGVVF